MLVVLIIVASGAGALAASGARAASSEEDQEPVFVFEAEQEFKTTDALLEVDAYHHLPPHPGGLSGVEAIGQIDHQHGKNRQDQHQELDHLVIVIGERVEYGTGHGHSFAGDDASQHESRAKLTDGPGKAVWVDRFRHLPLKIETVIEGGERPVAISIEFSEFLLFGNEREGLLFYPRTINHLLDGKLFKQTTVTLFENEPPWERFPVTRLRKRGKALREAAAALEGRELGNAALEAAGKASSAAAKPITDMRGTVEYRVHMAGVLTRRAAGMALERIQESD